MTKWKSIFARFGLREGTRREAVARLEAQVANAVGNGSWRNLADEARVAGNYIEAAQYYSGYLSGAPDDAAIHVQCGHMYKEGKDLVKAERHYTRALSLTPHDPDLHLQLGHFFKVAGRTSEAAEAYRRAASYSLGWAEPLAELAAFSMAGKLPQRVERESADSPTASGPAGARENVRIVSPLEWAVLGPQPVVEFEGPKDNEFKVDFLKLSDFLGPVDSESDRRLLIVTADAKFDTARGTFVAAYQGRLGEGPHVATVNGAGGEILAQIGIIVTLREGVKLAEEARDAGNYIEAARHYSDYLSGVPDDAAIHVQCGHMYKEGKDFLGAEKHYTQALSLTPDDPDLHLQMGHFFKTAGRTSEAAQAYRRAASYSLGWAEPLAELAAFAMAGKLPQRVKPGATDLLTAGAREKVEIISPLDWAVTGPQPVVEFAASKDSKFKVGFLKLSDFLEPADPQSRQRQLIATAEAKFDPSRGTFVAGYEGWLEDGPQVATVIGREGESLAQIGIIVDLHDGRVRTYLDLIEDEQSLLKRDAALIERHIADLMFSPSFHIIIDNVGGGSLDVTLESLEAQNYAGWRHWVAATDHWDSAFSDTFGDFVVVLKAGDRLAPDALYDFAKALNGEPTLDLIYGDEDILLASGERGQPFHKPAWSPDYLETLNYIGYGACFRESLAGDYVADEGYYGIILRLTERTSNICHIRKVLITRADATTGHSIANIDAERRALEARLQRTGRQGIVQPLGAGPGAWKVQVNPRATPLISIVIPTAGKTILHNKTKLDLVVNCVQIIKDRSTYTNMEIIIVDNGDLSHFQLQALTDLGCSFVTFTEVEFNVATKLSLGASIANGEFLILMNDDIEIITPRWIEELLSHFEKPHVGVVGLKLLYPNDQIQHAGVVHNYGNPDHVRRGAERADHGYFFSTCGVRNFGSVTGACMMVRKSLHDHEAVQGYSKELAISFNDIDFCHKISVLGYAIVYTPHAELIHFESQSREPTMIQSEWDYYQKRWGKLIASDPYYNDQCLSVAPPTFETVVNRVIL